MNFLQKKNKSIFAVLYLAFALISQYSSFHTTGHMMVARIAEIELEGTRILQQMNDILAIVSPFTKENKYPFVESAPYPDDIKYIGLKSMNGWHFHDNYINGERKLTKGEMTNHNLKNETENIVWATNQAKGVLRNTKLSLVDDRLNKSIYLRLLIHFYGDLHQPLHNVSLVNDEFSKGDQGGNLFKVDLPGARDLHSLWDMCVKNYPDIQHPLTDKKFNMIDSFSKKVMNEYPRSDENIQKRLEITSVKEISEESIDLAINYVYNGIENGEAPSEEYLTKGRKIIDEQIAVAGYRLADLMKNLFNDENVLKMHVKKVKDTLVLDNIKKIAADLE